MYAAVRVVVNRIDLYTHSATTGVLAGCFAFHTDSGVGDIGMLTERNSFYAGSRGNSLCLLTSWCNTGIDGHIFA